EKTGAHRTVKRYDEAGNQLEFARYGPDGKPAPNKEGHYRATQLFDARGRKYEATLYYPTERRRLRYDDRGNMIDLLYLDADGRPQLQPDGYSRVTCRYDDRGRVVGEAYLGPD